MKKARLVRSYPGTVNGLSRTFRVASDVINLRGLMKQAIDPRTDTQGLYEIRQLLQTER